MVDAQQVHQIQTDIARSLIGACRQGSHASVSLFWSQIGRSTFGRFRGTPAGGAATDVGVSLPREAGNLLATLRSTMYEEGKGAWLSVVIDVDASGKYSFAYNYDQRPDWNAPGSFDHQSGVELRPRDEAFVEDLDRFPRVAEALPGWYPESVAPTASQHRIVSRIDLPDSALLPDSLGALRTDAGWSQVAESVRDHVSGVLADEGSTGVSEEILAQQVYERVFAEVLAARDAAVVKRLWGPAATAAGFPAKSTDVPDDERVDNPSATLEILLEDVSDVISIIAEHQLALAG